MSKQQPSSDDTKKKTKRGSSKQEAEIDSLHSEIASLQKKLEEAEQITKRAQSDYLRLKMDMDAYTQRSELAQQSAQSEALMKVAKQLLPFVNQLRQMVISTPGDLEGNKRVDGVHLVYTKAIKDLEQLGISPISAKEGDEPDLNLHLPVGTTPVDDKKLQGKIVKLVEQGYQLDRDDEQRVILPCKVVVGQGS